MGQTPEVSCLTRKNKEAGQVVETSTGIHRWDPRRKRGLLLVAIAV